MGGFSLGQPDLGLDQHSSALEELHRTLDSSSCLGDSTGPLIVPVILVGYAQTAVVGIVLLTGSTVYTELSVRSRTSKFRS